MFQSKLKNYLNRLKEAYRLKDVTLRKLAPLLGMLAVCTTIAVFWNVSDSLFLRMVGYATFLSLFWFQLHEKIKDVIIEIYLTKKRSRYGYLRSIVKNIAYSILISAIIVVASLIFDKIEVGLIVITVTSMVSIVSSIMFLKDKKPTDKTPVDVAMRRHSIISLFKSRYGFEISLARDLALIEGSVTAITRLGYLDYYLNVMKDYDAWMKLDLKEINRNKQEYFENLERQIFDYAEDHDEADVLNSCVSKAINAVVHQRIDIAHYLD